MSTFGNRFPFFVGFDHLFQELDALSERTVKFPTFPPYNIAKIDDKTYVIELAAAGFAQTDIELTLDGAELRIRGEMKPNDNVQYAFKGIAERAFERTFTLADTLTVKNAEMLNGMLKIYLESVLPFSKARKIEIGAGDQAKSKQLLTE